MCDVKRNGGTIVDLAQGTVSDREDGWVVPDRLIVGATGLYYARPFPENYRLLTYHERWLLPAQGWSVSRFQFDPRREIRQDWYIEPDIIEISRSGSLWRVRDVYVDVDVYEGVRYELHDADELAAGLAAGEISVADTVVALNALAALCAELKRNGFSGRALLAEFAPGLPS